MLKRNIRIIVRENLVLKAKMKKLESKVKDNTASEESYNMLFRIGKSFQRIKKNLMKLRHSD